MSHSCNKKTASFKKKTVSKLTLVKWEAGPDTSGGAGRIRFDLLQEMVQASQFMDV